MGKGKKHLGKNELNALMSQQRRDFDAISRAVLIVAMVILHEAFSFDSEALSDFVDRFWDTLEYFNNSKDYQKLLEEWNQFFWEEAGIKVIDYDRK